MAVSTDPQIKSAESGAITGAVWEHADAKGAMGGNVLAVIWSMIAKYQTRMWVAVGLGVCSALLLIVPPFAAAGITGALLDDATGAALIWAAVLLGAGVGSTVLFGLSTTVSHYIAADVQRDQREALGDKLGRVPLGVFARISPVELRQLLVDDVEKIEDGIAHLIPETTAAFVGPGALFLAMMVVDWRLGLAASLPTVAGFMVMNYIMRQGVAPTNAFNAAQAEIAATMGEVVRAIPVVKTFNEGDAALTRAKAAVSRFQAIVDNYITWAVVPSNWFFLLATSNLVLVTPLSIWLMGRGAVGLPDVIFFHLGAMSMALLISGMFGITTRLRLQEGVVARWFAMQGQPDLPQVRDGPEPAGADVRFDAVRFGYGDATVIHDLTLDVPARTSLALVGPSGSGKSTLARLLARFWDVEAGKITVGGVDLREMAPDVLARHVSFVFQDVFLFSRSVRDNLAIGNPDATDAQIVAAAKAAQAHDFVAGLPDGYDTVIGAKLGLSMGQKQRLAIARAILRDAPVLVLDEATAFADPENEREVQRALSALTRDKTLVVIAHRLSTIRHADCIAFIDRGRVAECGTHDALMAKDGAYAAQWRSHSAARSFTLRN
ncbi:MAG: ABC transporter ATP-binding protein [Pseudomonadota bacterium]